MKIDIPQHQLANYRIALEAWQNSKQHTNTQWERVLRYLHARFAPISLESKP